MRTLHDYFASRRGLILIGHITESQIYKAYCRFAMERGEQPLSFEAVRPRIHSEIWQIRIWWARLATYHAECHFD